MTDIGFGLLDRRTVITVLFTLVLMQLLFGLQIPIDIKDVVQLFIGLVVLTGYIYLARTIYRLPVAIIISTYVTARKMKNSTGYLSDEIKKIKKELPAHASSKTFSLRLKLIFTPISLIPLWFISVLTFGEIIEKKYGEEFILMPVFYNYHKSFLDGVFGSLDRIGIILIAVIAAIPQYGIYVKAIGISGLIIMIVLFTLRGDFTALLKDILEKKKGSENSDNESVSKQDIEVKNSRNSPMFVEVVNSTENPIKINNSKSEPLYVDFYSMSSKIDGLPVHITGNYHPLPVRVENAIYVSTSPETPLHVEVENLSLPVEIENSSPIPVVVKKEDDYE